MVSAVFINNSFKKKIIQTNTQTQKKSEATKNRGISSYSKPRGHIVPFFLTQTNASHHNQIQSLVVRETKTDLGNENYQIRFFVEFFFSSSQTQFASRDFYQKRTRNDVKRMSEFGVETKNI